jgi:hypothetical protein
MTRIAAETCSFAHSQDEESPPPPKPAPSLSLTVDRWSATANAWFDHQLETLESRAKSAALTVLDWLPIKQASPYSTALLKHFVERSGQPYELGAIPPEWQAWIKKATHGKTGTFHDLSPYDSGLYDLRNSLGHFDVQVTRNHDGTKTYRITDTYQFGFVAHDTQQRGRHGFPLGQLSPTELKLLTLALPRDEYANPGGFTERWEVKHIGRETFLVIPQAFLANQGTPFKVTGSFTA